MPESDRYTKALPLLIKAGFTGQHRDYDLEWRGEDQLCYWPIGILDSDKREVVYAFTVEEQVLYIGYTDRGAHRRFNAYQYPDKKRPSCTDARINLLLKDCLKRQRRVRIFLWFDLALAEIGDFRVNHCASLEKTLIRDINPPWNRRT